MSSETNRGMARFFGEKVEEWAEKEHAVACLGGVVDGELLEPRSREELPVEVKGVVLRYGEEEQGRLGRVRFWKRQHERLRERDGTYLVAVYSTQCADPVQYDRFVHWSSLDEIMEEGGYSWYEASEHRMRSEQTQIPWRQFFPESNPKH